MTHGSAEAQIACGLYVLVAEDDEISATILLHRLRKEGLEVVHHDNGRHAYEAALDRTPDLVILDTNFHRRKLTLIDEIHAALEDTGVLVLVNHSDEECVIRSMLAEPDSVKLSGAALDQLND